VGLAVLGVAAAALGLTLLWLRSKSGRGFVARRVEAAVTDQIKGRLRIGAITRIAWAGVSARDVRFAAPDGGDVIVVDDVDMAIRWWSLLRGRLISPAARARGGRVVLREGRGGELTIETAMQDRKPAPAPTGAPRSEARSTEATLDLQRRGVSGVTLVATVSGVPDARVSHIGGALRITVRGPDAIQVIATTHSPFILDAVAPDAVQVFALRDDGTAAVRSLAEHPEAARYTGALSTGQLWTLDVERD